MRFRVDDAATLPSEAFDVVTAFDVIHDLPRPQTTLTAIHTALRAGGTFLMYDASAPATLEAQTLPWATMMYGISLNACLASGALVDAGFVLAGVHPVKGDPMNALHVARRS